MMMCLVTINLVLAGGSGKSHLKKRRKNMIITGTQSGVDTEAIISDLVKNHNNNMKEEKIKLRLKMEKKYRKAIEAECQFKERTGEIMSSSYKRTEDPLYHKVQMITCEIKNILTEKMKIEEQLADEMIKSRMKNDRIAAGVASYEDYAPVNVDDIIQCSGRFHTDLLQSAKKEIKHNFLIIGMDSESDGHLFVHGNSLFDVYNEDGELDRLCAELYKRVYGHPYFKLHPQEIELEIGELLEKVLPCLKLKQEELTQLLKEVIFELEREFRWEVPDCYSKLKYVAVATIVYNPAGNRSITEEATAIAATKSGVAKILDYVRSIGGDVVCSNPVFEATVASIDGVQALV